jgi:hypothetical protein
VNLETKPGPGLFPMCHILKHSVLNCRFMDAFLSWKGRRKRTMGWGQDRTKEKPALQCNAIYGGSRSTGRLAGDIRHEMSQRRSGGRPVPIAITPPPFRAAAADADADALLHTPHDRRRRRWPAPPAFPD